MGISDCSTHVRPKLRAELALCFVHYKDLEPNKEVSGTGWGDKAAAEKILEQAKERFQG